MSVFHQKQLEETVSITERVEDLIPILKHIPINKLKDFIKQNIDTTLARKVHLNSSSIDDIIPTDVIRHILSYQGLELHTTKCVNKQWNKLCEQNEKKYYLDIEQSLNHNSPIKFDKNVNKTWIINTKRTQLTKIEKELGYKNCLSHLEILIEDLSSSGDRIFVHNGVYQMENGLSVDHDVSIIGIGHKVIIIDDKHPSLRRSQQFWMVGYPEDWVTPTVYVENISFDGNLRNNKYRNGILHISTGSKLWLNKCRFKLAQCGIHVQDISELNIKDCVFDGGNTAVRISPFAASVNIEDSMFKHCGISDDISWISSEENACIQIQATHNALHYGDEEPCVKLRCNGNVFEDNLCYSIAERALPVFRDGLYVGMSSNPLYIDNTELYQVKNNVLKGYNATKLKKGNPVTDANQIYYNDEDLKGRWDLF